MGHKEHQSSPEQKMLLSNRLLKKNPNHPPNANMYKEGILVAPDRNFVKCQYEMLKWLQQKKKKGENHAGSFQVTPRVSIQERDGSDF